MRTYDVAHQLYVHITWCTYDRLPLISTTIEQILRRVIEDTCKELGLQLIALEMVPDHAHLLIRFQPAQSLSEAVKIIKGRTSRLVTHKTGQAFQWQKGYGIDTVGPKALETAKSYVLNQKSHHKNRFED